MRIGHVIALIGAVFVIVGGVAFDWQVFELADVTAAGYELPWAGQAILLMGALGLLASIGGLLTRKRYQAAGVTLSAAIIGIGLLIYANMAKLMPFADVMMPYESIEILGGFTVSLIGMFVMFVGPLVVMASEPRWSSDAQFLRVALLWRDAVIEERVLTESQTFTIGDHLQNDFVIPDEHLPKKFPLFRAGRKGEYAIGLTSELNGQITVNQKTEDVAAFVKKATDNVGGVNYVPISLGDWGIVQLSSDLRVFFQFVQPEAARSHRRGILGFEEGVAGSFASSFFVQAAFVVLCVLLWQEKFDPNYVPDTRLEMELTAEIDTVLIEEPPEEDGEEEEETSKKAGGEEGKFGDEEEDPDKKSKIPELDAKMVDKIDVKKVGLNDLLSTNALTGAGAISEIMSATSDGMSNKLAVAMGGEGSEFVIGHGAGGMGFTGGGPGGGGTGVGRIHGMGDIDTGAGRGVTGGMGKKRKRKVGKVGIGSGKSTGFCKKSHIASVVRRRAGAIRSCYEQRLQVKKDLKGKLTARWTINMDGSVKGVSAISNSMGDQETANCIFRHLRRMRFNKPEGGFCVVQWPFVFSPG